MKDVIEKLENKTETVSEISENFEEGFPSTTREFPLKT